LSLKNGFYYKHLIKIFLLKLEVDDFDHLPIGINKTKIII